MATKNTSASTNSFEQNLWDTANKLRGSVESSEYKHVVLSLIFLKFISDKFEAQRKSLVEQGMGDYVEKIEFLSQRQCVLFARVGALVLYSAADEAR
jgi:type I restriction enzyme M protein